MFNKLFRNYGEGLGNNGRTFNNNNNNTNSSVCAFLVFDYERELQQCRCDICT